MEWVLSWVKSGLLFGIVSSVILMLSPNKSYGKHIGLVVGLLFILVMLHPVMEVMEISEDTYLEYIKDFFSVSGTADNLSGNNLQMYQQAVEMQIKTTLQECGYSVLSVRVIADNNGNVSVVSLSFSDEEKQLDILEQYLHEMFGQEVSVEYENFGT